MGIAAAENIYRQILGHFPDHPDALHQYGILANQTHRRELAESLIRKSIAISPNQAPYHCNLGVVLLDAGNIPEAQAAFVTSLKLDPSSAIAHCLLGVALSRQNRFDDAIAHFQNAVSLSPNYLDPLIHLGNLYYETGNPQLAANCFSKAALIKPDSIMAWANLANACLSLGQTAEAEAAANKALSLNPNLPPVLVTLSNALKARDDLTGAENALKNALKIQPHYIEARINLANLLKEGGDPDRAILELESVIRLQPDSVDALSNLAGLYKDLSLLDSAKELFSRAIDIAPDRPDILSNACLTLLYDSKITPESERKIRSLWVSRHAKPNPVPLAFPARHKIRVGFLSPDFRVHPVGQNLLPLLQSIDRGRFEVFLYSNSPRSDFLTERFKSLASVFRTITHLSDDDAERILRDDQLDVLLELTLHLANNRLPLVARKPARFCLSWAGYPGSTGIPSIDFALSDPYIGPYDFPTLLLPKTFWCYDPLADEVPISSLPAIQNGFITFGCLNNFCKINPHLLSLWKQILHALPDARLLILAPQGAARQRVIDALEIDPSRILFHSNCPRKDFLLLHQNIDLILDPFPYNGHTSSLDALFMGVPVVTRVGQSPVSRGGWSILNNLGLPQLAAFNDPDYVSIVLNLANDLPRLQLLRKSLREQMRKSPLMNGQIFADDFSDLILNMIDGNTAHE